MEKDSVLGAISGPVPRAEGADRPGISEHKVVSSALEKAPEEPVNTTRSSLFEAIWGNPASPTEGHDEGMSLFEATSGRLPAQAEEPAATQPAPLMEGAEHPEGELEPLASDAEESSGRRARRRHKSYQARRADEQHDAILRNLEKLVPAWQDPYEEGGKPDEARIDQQSKNPSGAPP